MAAKNPDSRPEPVLDEADLPVTKAPDWLAETEDDEDYAAYDALLTAASSQDRAARWQDSPSSTATDSSGEPFLRAFDSVAEGVNTIVIVVTTLFSCALATLYVSPLQLFVADLGAEATTSEALVIAPATQTFLASGTNDPATLVDCAALPALESYRLAYQSGAALVLSSLNGDVSCRLQHGEARLQHPRWSRDGAQLIAADADTPSLHRFRLAERRWETLTLPDFVAVTHPTWSPSAERIAFRGVQADGQADLYMVTPQGFDLLRLTRHERDEIAPDWHPTANRLLFSTLSPARSFNNLYLLDLERDLTTITTRGDATYTDAQFSPDGSRIAATRTTAQGASEIAVYDASGVYREVTTIPRGIGPTWFSPQVLYFAEARPDGVQVLMRYDLQTRTRSAVPLPVHVESVTVR